MVIKKEEGDYKEYLVDIKDGDAVCDCLGGQYKKKCKHVKTVLNELYGKHKKGIINFDSDKRWLNNWKKVHTVSPEYLKDKFRRNF